MPHFENPVPTAVSVPGKFWPTFWKFLTVKNDREPAIAPGPFSFDMQAYENAREDEIRVTWLGHTTLILEVAGKRFLTDPVWAMRASPISFLGPKRFFRVPVDIDQLPPLDGILLSHDHYDHLDEKVIRQLAAKGYPFYCPLGVEKHLRKWGVHSEQWRVFNWGDSLVLDETCTLTATPARHFSGRGLRDRFTTLWTSWVIQGRQHKVFFGGDSGWWPGFADIGNTYGPFDLAILEIGAYGDTWPDIHMGPENALKAFAALKAGVMLPVHWGTYNLALHPWREPVQRLLSAAGPEVKIWLPRPGTCEVLPTESKITKWWE
ncbi:L-ascorbate metabolism protein UlaG, beta-lactamase superfamily [Chitinophaga costaii]|uniref:L-ascorbate metabolism protein UlaG, beta-lactamase superfamily n=1 Tax=Chitinophaga costaii TaxID=1335309 RepID=A0A1C4G6G2_9BACT|nr:MBL fold metallo-hydrolase [Chitinophaga costaii]PUZ20108.1 MBL fold metallo-hydrolase [Chitinophaga costaii]SCC63533.1 L-ascorbate metabolism protein UlaG, beta-lactamase superfamily [Chitinophaga costaii]